MQLSRSKGFIPAVALALAALAAPCATHAQPLSILPGNGCDLSRTQGRYGYLLTGHIMNFGDPEFYAAGGVLTLRVDGTFEMTGTQTQGGVVTPISPSAGTYTVDENCRGTALVGGQPYFNFVAVREGAQLEIIRTDLDAIVTGQAKKVARGCTVANVDSTYGYAFNAIVQNITIQGMFLPEAFFSGGGAVRIEAQQDGSGTAILDDTASFGGLVIKRHYEGTLEVSPDCTGRAVVTLPPNAPTTTNPVTVDAVWVDERNSVLLIQIDPGTFIAGEAKRVRSLP
ncbi:hypothetical protein K2Z84_13930 [Candidatus Binatia bacterium]|jgi:hypothetical protein|nr:hypothetical protein [Candidatus Binatia bacterium]